MSGWDPGHEDEVHTLDVGSDRLRLTVVLPSYYVYVPEQHHHLHISSSDEVRLEISFAKSRGEDVGEQALTVRDDEVLRPRCQLPALGSGIHSRMPGKALAPAARDSHYYYCADSGSGHWL